MPQVIVTYWRDIPSMVEARAGRRNKAKRMLSDRFQEAIDRAAMRGGAGDTDSYLAEWRKSGPVECNDDLEAEAEAAAEALETAYDDERLRRLVAAGGAEKLQG